MLLRVLNAIGNDRDRDRFERLIQHDDVTLISLTEDQIDYDLLLDYPCDIMVIERSVLPEPVADSARELTGTGYSRAVVVLTDDFGIQEQALMKGSGMEVLLPRTLSDDQLADIFTSIIRHRKEILHEVFTARRAVRKPALTDFVASSEAMQQFLQVVRRAVDSEYPLLVRGETGVGKERLARAIHYASRRADGPFLAINCSGAPDPVIESHLFGQVGDTPVGTSPVQRGGLELAHGGTLFIDEICDLPIHLQVKLLWTLENHEVRANGAGNGIPVDLRVIASTSRDVQRELEEGRLRNDLYLRLGTVTVEMPPLRERLADLPLLAESFTREIASRTGKQIQGISHDAVELLSRYHWPGNIRELINVLERAVLLCRDDTIDTLDLPDELTVLRTVPPGSSGPDDGGEFTIRIPEEWYARSIREVRAQAVRRVEKDYLTRLLEQTGGRIGETAELAGIEPRSLYGKMKSYGLNKDEFKN